MKTKERISFEPVTHSDIATLTTIMKAAFDEDTRRHLHRPCGGPLGYDNGEFIRKWFIESDSEGFKILADGVLIGGVNVFMNEDRKEKFLGCLFIDPAYQDLGYGSSVWQMLEEKYPETVIWRTETPGFSRRNHHFYINKCGFKVVKITDPKDEEERQYIMEKEMIKK